MISEVIVGAKLSGEFPVTEALRQECCIAPILFRIYLLENVKLWRAKCRKMRVPVGENILYTLHFADNQVICAQDEEDTHYMFRKLQEEYHKWCLQINLDKKNI